MRLIKILIAAAYTWAAENRQEEDEEEEVQMLEHNNLFNREVVLSYEPEEFIRNLVNRYDLLTSLLISTQYPKNIDFQVGSLIKCLDIFTPGRTDYISNFGVVLTPELLAELRCTVIYSRDLTNYSSGDLDQEENIARIVYLLLKDNDIKIFSLRTLITLFIDGLALKLFKEPELRCYQERIYNIVSLSESSPSTDAKNANAKNDYSRIERLRNYFETDVNARHANIEALIQFGTFSSTSSFEVVSRLLDMKYSYKKRNSIESELFYLKYKFIEIIFQSETKGFQIESFIDNMFCIKNKRRRGIYIGEVFKKIDENYTEVWLERAKVEDLTSIDINLIYEDSDLSSNEIPKLKSVISSSLNLKAVRICLKTNDKEKPSMLLSALLSLKLQRFELYLDNAFMDNNINHFISFIKKFSNLHTLKLSGGYTTLTVIKDCKHAFPKLKSVDMSFGNVVIDKSTLPELLELAKNDNKLQILFFEDKTTIQTLEGFLSELNSSGYDFQFNLNKRYIELNTDSADPEKLIKILNAITLSNFVVEVPNNVKTGYLSSLLEVKNADWINKSLGTVLKLRSDEPPPDCLIEKLIERGSSLDWEKGLFRLEIYFNAPPKTLKTCNKGIADMINLFKMKKHGVYVGCPNFLKDLCLLHTLNLLYEFKAILSFAREDNTCYIIEGLSITSTQFNSEYDSILDFLKLVVQFDFTCKLIIFSGFNLNEAQSNNILGLLSKIDNVSIYFEHTNVIVSRNLYSKFQGRLVISCFENLKNSLDLYQSYGIKNYVFDSTDASITIELMKKNAILPKEVCFKKVIIKLSPSEYFNTNDILKIISNVPRNQFLNLTKTTIHGDFKTADLVGNFLKNLLKNHWKVSLNSPTLLANIIKKREAVLNFFKFLEKDGPNSRYVTKIIFLSKGKLRIYIHSKSTMEAVNIPKELQELIEIIEHEYRVMVTEADIEYIFTDLDTSGSARKKTLVIDLKMINQFHISSKYFLPFIKEVLKGDSGIITIIPIEDVCLRDFLFNLELLTSLDHLELLTFSAMLVRSSLKPNTWCFIVSGSTSNSKKFIKTINGSFDPITIGRLTIFNDYVTKKTLEKIHLLLDSKTGICNQKSTVKFGNKTEIEIDSCSLSFLSQGIGNDQFDFDNLFNTLKSIEKMKIPPACLKTHLIINETLNNGKPFIKATLYGGQVDQYSEQIERLITQNSTLLRVEYVGIRSSASLTI